jgi:hypothetical protein
MSKGGKLIGQKVPSRARYGRGKREFSERSFIALKQIWHTKDELGGAGAPCSNEAVASEPLQLASAPSCLGTPGFCCFLRVSDGQALALLGGESVQRCQFGQSDAPRGPFSQAYLNYPLPPQTAHHTWPNFHALSPTHSGSLVLVSFPSRIVLLLCCSTVRESRQIL